MVLNRWDDTLVVFLSRNNKCIVQNQFLLGDFSWVSVHRKIIRMTGILVRLVSVYSSSLRYHWVSATIFDKTKAKVLEHSNALDNCSQWMAKVLGCYYFPKFGNWGVKAVINLYILICYVSLNVKHMRLKNQTIITSETMKKLNPFPWETVKIAMVERIPLHLESIIPLDNSQSNNKLERTSISLNFYLK